MTQEDHLKAAEAMGMNLERYLLVHGISVSPVPKALAPPQAVGRNNHDKVIEYSYTPIEWEPIGPPIVILSPTSDTNPANSAEAAWAADLLRYNCIEEHQRRLMAQLEEGEVERLRLLERLSLGPSAYLW
ncbi:hypothetical protein RUND412_002031 [Rhizina undulata]